MLPVPKAFQMLYYPSYQSDGSPSLVPVLHPQAFRTHSDQSQLSKHSKRSNRRKTLNGDWTELNALQAAKVNEQLMQAARFNQQLNHMPPRQLFEAYESLDRETMAKETMMNQFLLQTCETKASGIGGSETPSDAGIGSTDSGGEYSNSKKSPDSSVLRKNSSDSGGSSSDSALDRSNDEDHALYANDHLDGGGSDGLGENEEAVSLAHIDDSKTMHSYIASRGQREREEDIYEVVPPKLRIRKTTEIIRT